MQHPAKTIQESPLVRRLVAPNPGVFTGPGTNTYLIGAGGRCAVLDPGPDDQTHIDAILEAADEAKARITLVLVTHSHPDHFPGARALQGRTGVPLCAHPSIRGVTRPLEHQQRIPLPGATAEAIYTPGHAGDHYCFLLPRDGSLFSGDLIVGQGTVVIAPPDGDMDQYLDSLRSLHAYGIRRIFPGHWDPIDDPDAKIDEYVEHRLERERQILEALRDGSASVPAIVERVYPGLDQRLRAAAAASVRAHLISLERRAIVRSLAGEATRYEPVGSGE